MMKEKEAYSEGLKDKQDTLVSMLSEKRKALRESEENIVYLKEEKGKKTARLSSLKEFHEGYLWCSEATRSIMKDKDQILAFGAVQGLVADHVEVPREYEVAVEAVLGEKLQYVVVRSQEDGIQAIDYLKANSTGRGSFIPLEVRGRAAAETPGYLAGAVKLIDRVKVKEDFQKIADYLLGDVLLIPNLETGLSLWRRNGFSGTFVTPDGDIVTPHGVLTGGNGAGTESSLLRNKREISELEQELERFEAHLDEENVRRDGLRDGIRQGEEELERIKTEQRGLELSLHNGLKDIEGLEKEVGWVEKRLNVLRFNRDNLVAEGAQAAEKISSLESEVAANEEKCRKADEAITALKERGEQSRKALENLERKLTERMVLLKSLEEKETSCRSNLERLQMEADGLEDEIAAKAADIEFCDREFLETTRKVEEEREELKSLYEAGRQMEQELDEQTTSHRAKEDALRGGEAENRETRQELEKLVTETRDLQMELQGLRFQAEALKRNTQEKYSVDLDGMAAGFRRLDDGQVAELTEKIAANTKAIDEFGEVNLLALSEHNVLKERYDFLTAQVTDLNRSLESLQQTISRINRVSRQRFSETFEAVNARFKEVFPKLFPGGRGELRLTDESDMLETGVDIDIRTPGKKTQNVMLLSGGEKSLAAVALIFGIILYRPTPFLILDEVDAALDDSNVSLFNRLLSEIAGDSQIIIITHNKKTMEVANSLYGVTMEKSGISTLVSVNMN
jgi:chromosome segregation protein